jgi:hypothetical protein
MHAGMENEEVKVRVTLSTIYVHAFQTKESVELDSSRSMGNQTAIGQKAPACLGLQDQSPIRSLGKDRRSPCQGQSQSHIAEQGQDLKGTHQRQTMKMLID